MRISDWSSDVCSSDLAGEFGAIAPAAGQGDIDQGDIDLGIAAESRIAPPQTATPHLGGHTCIGVVATNAALDKTALRHVAGMAHDGLDLAIRPVQPPFDGDTRFAMATADRPEERRVGQGCDR